MSHADIAIALCRIANDLRELAASVTTDMSPPWLREGQLVQVAADATFNGGAPTPAAGLRGVVQKYLFWDLLDDEGDVRLWVGELQDYSYAHVRYVTPLGDE